MRKPRGTGKPSSQLHLLGGPLTHPGRSTLQQGPDLCDLGSKVTHFLGLVSSLKRDVVGVGGDSAGATEVLGTRRETAAPGWRSATRDF